MGKKAKLIGFCNLKGGVGKTVSVIAVATILQDRGKKVLVMDCDPQRNTTTVFKAESVNVPTLYDILFAGYTADECIQHTEMGDIIASDVNLINCDGRITPGPGMYKHIKKALKPVLEKYDFILFDTPPYRGVLLGNVLFAASGVVVPLEAELFGIQGLSDFYETIVEFQEDNEDLKILGLLRVKHKKNQLLSKNLEENTLPDCAAGMNTKVFKTTIRESVRVKEAMVVRQRLSEYAPKSTATLDYQAFVDELLEEVGE